MKINTSENDTYTVAESLEIGTFKINKIEPTADLYTISPAQFVYNGKEQVSTITPAEGAGAFDRVYYRKTGTWEKVLHPTDVGRVYIETIENDKYKADIYLKIGEFEITKAEPTAVEAVHDVQEGANVNR